MQAWKYYNPVQVFSALGARHKISELLPAQGDILLVSTKGMVERGTVAELIENSSRNWHIYHAKPNPSLDELDDYVQNLRLICQEKNISISCVVAMGGGSALDSAKALACSLASNLEKPLHIWLREKSKKVEKSLPLIVLPSTAGTGAEVTPFGTIWDYHLQKKYSLASPYCYPQYTLLDPELTYSLPWEESLIGALDALSHATETLWNKTATPMSIHFAKSALELVIPHLYLLEKDLDNKEARTAIQQGAYFAGMAISQSHSSLGHAISYPLTLNFGVPHGLSCSAFLLPIFEKINAENAFITELSPQLKQDIYACLTHFAPHRLIREYCTFEQAKGLIDEMFTPERAGTFNLTMKQKDVINILERGFNI